MNQQQGPQTGKLTAIRNALLGAELGRFQAAILAVLFACVWCVIGLLSGYLLSYLTLLLTTQGADASRPATVIFVLATLACTTWGIVQGTRLYRSFSAALGRGPED